MRWDCISLWKPNTLQSLILYKIYTYTWLCTSEYCCTQTELQSSKESWLSVLNKNIGFWWNMLNIKQKFILNKTSSSDLRDEDHSLPQLSSPTLFSKGWTLRIIILHKLYPMTIKKYRNEPTLQALLLIETRLVLYMMRQDYVFLWIRKEEEGKPKNLRFIINCWNEIPFKSFESTGDSIHFEFGLLVIKKRFSENVSE